MQNEKILDRLRKILALTTSPMEGEAQAAAAMLSKLLADHNLSVADLEQKGHAKPGVKQEGHDLGKAAFTWKLDLAESIAEHYFCAGLIDRTQKTVHFVGRPENVESLKMLYDWLIDQVKRIASEERKRHQVETGEHVDPLRWQVNFGIGAARRLGQRLVELKKKQAEDNASTALVLHHKSEISDFLEARYGYRIDGRRTQQEQQWDNEMQARRKAKEDLKNADLEAFYRAYPYERPLTPEQRIATEQADAAWWKAYEAKQARNAARRKGRATKVKSWKQMEADRQAEIAETTGREAANRVNLQPFLEGEVETPKAELA